MAFWDDISRKASDAANYTMKKAGELTGIAKVKFNLKTEEIKVEKLYESLGTYTYQKYRNDIDNDTQIMAVCLEIDEVMAQIAKLQEELAQIKNVKICSGCKSEIGKFDAYCPICGAKQEYYCKDDDCKQEDCCKDDDCKQEDCCKGDDCKQEDCCKGDDCKQEDCCKGDDCKQEGCCEEDAK